MLPHQHEVTWDLELSLGRLRTAEHRPADAARLLEDVAAIRQKLGDDRTENVRENRCEGLLLWLGATEHNRGTLAAQIYCALDKIWYDEPAEAPALDNIRPLSVSYSLYQYDATSNPLIASGTLNNIAEPAQLAAGTYLLTLDIHTAAGRELHRAVWLLAGPWDVGVYAADRISLTGLPAPAGPVNQMQVANLAFGSLFKDAPQRPDEYWITTAQTTINLPPGNYRFWGRGDDGIRVMLDGGRIIDAWPRRHPHEMSGDAKFDGQPHTIRVEHYQQGGESQLWIRIQPLSDAATSFAASLTPRIAPDSK